MIAVIGAGAAGCFAAIGIKEKYPHEEVTVFESSEKALAKVAVTGGGRCNLTNSFRKVEKLEDVYPRGTQLMKRALRRFSQQDTMDWFEDRGVRLLVQDDECVFPVSQDAMQIVRTLENNMRSRGVKVVFGHRLEKIEDSGEGFRLHFRQKESVIANKVVLTIGGSSASTLAAMLPQDIEIAEPVPSLFTFKIADPGIRSLMGAVVDDAALSIAGTAFRSSGTLLLTDWGVSGPATLRLSSYAARHLAGNGYKGTLCINWLHCKEDEARALVRRLSDANPKKQVSNTHPPQLSDRLWRHLVNRSGIREDLRWAETGSKSVNKLVNTLLADSYSIEGRARFKEEFVTCGGVDLNSVNINTLESKTHPGLFFAGEVLDIDGVTGGFNLQAAWSTAMTIVNAL